MKLDYKTSNHYSSFQYKRYLGLGGLSLLCLCLAFSNSKTTRQHVEPVVLPVIATPVEPITPVIAEQTPVPEKQTQETQTQATPTQALQIPVPPKPPKPSNQKQLAFSAGAIRNSLVSSGKKAGLDYKVINQMVEILGGKIDFSTDLRPNDSFRVLYEEKGPILAVEFVNQGETYQAIRYTDKTGQTGYFSPEGHGLNEAFLRSPVNFVNISSGFGPRKHPIYHRLKQHKGVDYRAPSGTPVLATANAKVVFVGNKGGYGNAIELQHGARYSTFYAHLSRFAKNIKSGVEVKQGQIIGYVGRTGLATGDHLHYEFRIDGVHRNPLTAAMPKQNSIAAAQRQQFIAHAKEMIRLLDLHQNIKSIKTKMAHYFYQHPIVR